MKKLEAIREWLESYQYTETHEKNLSKEKFDAEFQYYFIEHMDCIKVVVECLLFNALCIYFMQSSENQTLTNKVETNQSKENELE